MPFCFFSGEAVPPASETEEQRRERVNFADIPEELWRMFPERDRYITNIMKFSGYLNRNSILKLKNDAAVKEMFVYAVNLAKLITDKTEMFGMFAPDPALLIEMGMPPGTRSTFDHFLDKVDKLLPKPVKLKSGKTDKSRRSNSKGPSAAIKKTSEKTEDATEKMESWMKRMEEWFTEELPKLPNNKMTVEEAMKTFTLTQTDDGFSWRCNNKSHVPQNLQKSKSTGNILLSNATRHLQNTCWMKPTPNTPSPTSTSVPKAKLQVGISSFCTLKPASATTPSLVTPPPTTTIPIEISTTCEPSSPVSLYEQIQKTSTPIVICPKETNVKPSKVSKIEFQIVSDSQSMKESKNLLPPAGHHESTDGSGR